MSEISDAEMTRLYPGSNDTVLSSPFGRAFSTRGSLTRKACLLGGALLVFTFNVERLNRATLALYDDGLIGRTVDSIPPTEMINNKYCKVLITNEEHQYHYEVLESILALYPLPQTSSCNRSRINFTISISDGEDRDLWRNRSASWYEYATQVVARNEYTAIQGQFRYLDKVIRNSSRPATSDFDYQIGASCFCKRETDVQWLLKSKSHFCVFHSTCERFANSSQAMWVNPKMKQFFFPKILPQFEHPRTINTTTHNLCIIGSVKRREYRLVRDFMGRRPNHPGIRFHHFGGGELKPRMRKFVTVHSIPNYTAYQFDLYMTCDAILSLVTRLGHSEYFEGPTQLSGAIVQAAAYGKPILIHNDLVPVYQKYLTYVETHGDDHDSFSLGLKRLINHLTVLKAAANNISSLPE